MQRERKENVYCSECESQALPKMTVGLDWRAVIMTFRPFEANLPLPVQLAIITVCRTLDLATRED
jgi:hypothetical protein